MPCAAILSNLIAEISTIILYSQDMPKYGIDITYIDSYLGTAYLLWFCSTVICHQNLKVHASIADRMQFGTNLHFKKAQILH